MKQEINIASRLRQRITIQQQVLTPDTGGGMTRTWNDVATVWAEIIPLNAHESLREMQLQSTVTHRVTIRYRSGVTAAMRISYDSRLFNIRSVTNPNERDALLEMLVEENVAT